MSGYATGCCTCMDHKALKEELQLEGDPLLLMGIGYRNSDMNRRQHPLREDFIFPTKKKQLIPFKIW